MLRKILLSTVILLSAIIVKAEGYSVNVQGNKQTGMGHVGTAINFGASSMQWNPGILSFMNKKYEISLGGTLTFIDTEYTSLTGTEKSKNPTGNPFYLYSSFKATNNLSVGLGVYTPFGNKVKWGNDWSGKYLIQDIDLKAVFIQPTLSYKINNWFSVGAGLIICKGSFELNKAIPLGQLPDGKVNISGSKIEYGYNLGAFFKLNEKLNIGISYRSEIKVKLGMNEGKVKFEVDDAVKAMFPNGRTSAELPLPSSLNFGVAYKLTSKLLISADVNSVKWNAYENLSFDFETETAALKDQISKRNWKNTMIYRIGAQYTANKKLDLRAGFYYDETPTNKEHYSPETPGANKIGISAGFSYKITDKLCLDASLLYVNGEKTKAYETSESSKNIYGANGFGGEYNNSGWLPGIGVSYSF